MYCMSKGLDWVIYNLEMYKRNIILNLDKEKKKLAWVITSEIRA